MVFHRNAGRRASAALSPGAGDMAPLADETTTLLKALAHPARLMICCLLKDGERSVGDIEQTIGVRQPRLSRELSKLREEGLVATRRASKVVFYRLSDARARAMVEAVCAVMLGRADASPGVRASLAPPAALPGRRGGYGVFARTGVKPPSF